MLEALRLLVEHEGGDDESWARDILVDASPSALTPGVTWWHLASCGCFLREEVREPRLHSLAAMWCAPGPLLTGACLQSQRDELESWLEVTGREGTRRRRLALLVSLLELADELRTAPPRAWPERLENVLARRFMGIPSLPPERLGADRVLEVVTPETRSWAASQLCWLVDAACEYPDEPVVELVSQMPSPETCQPRGESPEVLCYLGEHSSRLSLVELLVCWSGGLRLSRTRALLILPEEAARALQEPLGLAWCTLPEDCSPELLELVGALVEGEEERVTALVDHDRGTIPVRRDCAQQALEAAVVLARASLA